MSKHLVLIHGRSQEQKDAGALKAEWLAALAEGLAKNGLTLPIAETQVRFPFYGDTLYEMSQGQPADTAADVIIRGSTIDREEERFTRSVLEELRTGTGVTDAQVQDMLNPDALERGIQHWERFQGVLRAIDRFVPFGSGSAIALFTHDVYMYLKNSAIRQHIEQQISAAFTPAQPAVVVSHSLGTIVAYNLLRREGHLRGWKVPLFVTLGSPLALGEIRTTLKSFAPTCCPPCAAAWFNAMDERDVVALYALTPSHFPLDPTTPAIHNKADVKNHTRNRHGIAGYLDDDEVAKRIYDALTEEDL